MASNMGMHDNMAKAPFWRGMRWLVWGGAAALLALPLIAMQFTREVQWSAFDFLVMGAMLGAVGLAFELALRVARDSYYMVGAGIAAGTAFLLTWANLAVGVIGNEDNPANLMFFGVVAIALVGTILARLQPRGMAQAMQATAIVQAGTVIAALLLDAQWRVPVIVAGFAGMWLLASVLFAKSAQAPRPVARLY